MKEYPYISIVLYEFYVMIRKILIEDEMFIITGVTEYNGVYGVRFMKSESDKEHMLDLPVDYYKERLRCYKSLERNTKLNKLGV
jgi:hypothetical protein